MFITKALRVTLLTAVLTIVAGNTNVAEAAKVETVPFTQVEIVAETNEARAEEGLPALTINEKLTVAAQLKADDMVANKYFAHYSPAGVTPWHWFDVAGYNYIEAGENLASGFTKTDKLMNAWLNSPTHRANIMGAQFEEIGIGVAKTVTKGKTSWYVVQMFGTL
jgi:uncharacterized protein YkwD